VAKFRFSRRAEADLLSIGQYTLQKWGETQAARYLGELEDCCQHVLFYRQESRGILISRILHQRMLPERHVMDSEEEGS
jgi:plasmid stabilization system protein ParE